MSKEPRTWVLEEPSSSLDVGRLQPDPKQENVSLIDILLIEIIH